MIVGSRSNKDLSTDAARNGQNDLDAKLIELKWIERLLDQVVFANKACRHYSCQLIVKKFCDCYPNCHPSSGGLE